MSIEGSLGIELVEDDRGGVTVLRDGHPQSYVQLDDPELLAFEYVQHLAIGIDLLAPGPAAVTHVGGAGLTLARYVQHTRPGSPQIVLEPDAALTERVRAELPLPRGHRIRVRPQSGAQGLPALKDDSADALVVDAFEDGRVPADLTDERAVAHYHRIVRPGGLVLLNLADEPGLRYVARVVATLAQHRPSVCLLATHEVLKSKRYGNAVLLASDAPLDEASIARRVRRCTAPSGTRTGHAVRALAASAAPLTPPGMPSPVPPDPDRWRLR